jgi:hypothetical protein
VRWQFGVPPKGNANFAWVQHFIHHLAPHGMAGIPLGTLRNDNFTVADMYEIYTGKKSATRIALKAEDVRRRRREAETFIKEHPDTSTSAQK